MAFSITTEPVRLKVGEAFDVTAQATGGDADCTKVSLEIAGAVRGSSEDANNRVTIRGLSSDVAGNFTADARFELGAGGYHQEAENFHIRGGGD